MRMRTWETKHLICDCDTSSCFTFTFIHTKNNIVCNEIFLRSLEKSFRKYKQLSPCEHLLHTLLCKLQVHFDTTWRILFNCCNHSQWNMVRSIILINNINKKQMKNKNCAWLRHIAKQKLEHHTNTQQLTSLGIGAKRLPMLSPKSSTARMGGTNTIFTSTLLLTHI